ncbi:MAG TPA: hypothetical protein VNM48_04015 [Chloroflexota bacterium]|nr:hypothetical protein [Chloroflexota bacterium]
MAWTEIQPANLYGAAMGGIAAGNKLADDNFARRDQHDLRQLAPGIANGDPEALIRATAINPDMAAKYDETHVALVKRAAGAANYVMEVKKRGGSQQQLDGAMRTVGPYLSRLTGQPAPDRYDDAMIPHMEQLIATAQGIGGGAKPVDHPSSYDEFELSQSNPAYGAFLAGRQPTQLATISVPGGKLQVQWNSRTRQMTDMEGNPLNSDGSPQEAAPQAPEAAAQPVPQGPSGGSAQVLDNAYQGETAGGGGQPFYANVEASIAPFGGILGSTTGGKHNVGSLHAGGGAVDIPMGASASPEAKANADRMIAELEAKGYRVRDERQHPPGQKVWGGPHLHVEPIAGQVAQAPAQANPYAGRMGFTPDKPDYSAENQARAVQATKFAQGRALDADKRAAAADADRRRGSAPAGQRFRPDGSLEDIPGARQPASASAVDQKNINAIRAKVPQLQNSIRGLDRIDTALKGLDGALFDTGPMDAKVQRYTPAGQELDAAVGAIQNSVLALTRVPGVGSQSDLEARQAALQYPSLDKPPEVNRRTLANLKLFMRDLAKAYETAATSAPAQASQGGGWGIQKVGD